MAGSKGGHQSCSPRLGVAGVNGLEARLALREIGRPVSAVLCTGPGCGEALIEALAAGASDYIDPQPLLIPGRPIPGRPGDLIPALLNLILVAVQAMREKLGEGLAERGLIASSPAQ